MADREHGPVRKLVERAIDIAYDHVVFEAQVAGVRGTADEHDASYAALVAELRMVLETAILRGGMLGYSDADDDYRARLNELYAMEASRE